MLLLLAGGGIFAQAAPIQRAVWWESTDMLAGWHLRVPVVVANPDVHDSFDSTVGFDLDLTQALLDGGWPAAPGAAGRLSFFQLDEGSVRVVEYRSLGQDAADDGLVVGEVAARAYLGSFGSSATYDNRTRPDLHVEWTAPGKFAAGSSRYFMIYADTTANGDKPDAAPAEKDVAPLDARYWMSRGTTLYGRAEKLVLIGLEEDTSVTLSAYQFGKPRPIEFSEGSLYTNPVTLRSGEVKVIPISDNSVLLRVTANHPVLAAGISASNNAVGPVPSASGNLQGIDFVLPANAAGYTILKAQGTAQITVDAAMTQTLTPGMPLSVVQGDGQTHFVKASSPVMVFAWPDRSTQTVLPSQFGAPFGSVLIGQPYEGGVQVPSDSTPPKPPQSAQPPCTQGTLLLGKGSTVLMPLGAKTYYRGADFLSGALTYPKEGDRAAERSGTLDFRPLSFSTAPLNGCPTTFFTTASPSSTLPAPGRIEAIGGATGGDIAGALGGLQATRFTLTRATDLVAPYDRTLVTLRDSTGKVTVQGLNANDSFGVTIPFGVPLVNVTSNRPLLAIGNGVGAYFAGIDETPTARRIGPAEFRGYLVDLRPRDAQSLPLVGLASAGRPSVFHLTVRNLAKDASGNPATDTILLNTTPVANGWIADVNPRSVTLRGGESADVELTIQPPNEVREGSRLTLSVTATSSSLSTVSASVPTTTIVRTSYGVDMWFDRENGPKARTLTFDPGASQRVIVAIKNLAVVRDRFTLTASPLSEDWTSAFESSGNALAEVELDPGEVAAVPVQVRAPDGIRSQSVVQFTATSQSSAAASAQVTSTVRTRADLSIGLDADNLTLDAPPGTNATFKVTFRNRANDSVGINFSLTAQVPDGWASPDAFVHGFPIREVAGIPPASELPINVTIAVPANATRDQRAVIHFNLETLPQVLGDAVARESLDLTVLASARHALDPQPTAVLLTPDASGAVQATLMLHNTGNGAENLTVYPTELPAGFTTVFPGPLHMEMDARAPLTVDMRLAPGTPPGTYPVALSVTTDDGTPIPWRYNISVPLRRSVVFEGVSPLLGIPGTTTSARVAVENIGNVPLDLPPRLALPPGWDAQWSDEGRALEPGESAVLALRLTTPATAAPGDYELESASAWAENGKLAWRVETVVLKPQVEVDGRSVTVTIGNEGTGDARNVTVVLVVGGTEADRVLLQRVPAGGSSIAVLAGPASATDAEVRVLGPAQASDAPAPIAVHLEGAKKVPLPSAGLLLAAVGALALLRRSRR